MRLLDILTLKREGQTKEALNRFEELVEGNIRNGRVLYVVKNHFSQQTPYDTYIELSQFADEAIDNSQIDFQNPSREEQMLIGSYNSVAGNSLSIANKINPKPSIIKLEGNYYERAGIWTRDVSRMFSAGSYLSAAKAYKSLYEILNDEKTLEKIDRLVSSGLKPVNEAIKITANGVKMKQNLDENHPSRVRITKQYEAAIRMKQSLEEQIIE